MRNNHLVAVVSVLCVLLFLMYSPAANAQLTRQATLETNVPLKIPTANVTLPPGKYVVKVLETAGTRTIVQIWNDRQDKVLATVLTIPNYRLEIPEKVEFTFWETPKGEPLALRSWFWPGEKYGHEFVYPQKMAREIARQTGKTVPTVYTESQEPRELKTARLGATTPEGKQIELPEDYKAQQK